MTPSERSVWIIIVVLFALLCLLPRGCKRDSDDTKFVGGIEALKSKINEVEKEAARKDTLFSDSLKDIEAAKTPKLANFKKAVREVRDSLGSLPITNDTIQKLLTLVEEADSIIQLDSADIQVWQHRYENQVALNDSLRTLYPQIETVYRGEIKALRQENKSLKRKNTVLIIAGGVIAALALIR